MTALIHIELAVPHLLGQGLRVLSFSSNCAMVALSTWWSRSAILALKSAMVKALEGWKGRAIMGSTVDRST